MPKLQRPVNISSYNLSAWSRKWEQGDGDEEVKGTQPVSEAGVPASLAEYLSDPSHALEYLLEKMCSWTCPPSVSHLQGLQFVDPEKPQATNIAATLLRWPHVLTPHMWPPASISKFQCMVLLEQWVNKLFL